MPINSLRRESGIVWMLWRFVWGPINLFMAFFPLAVLNLMQFPSLLLLPFSRSAYRAYNRVVAYMIWGWWAWGVQTLVGLKVIVTGDDIPKKENAIVICNHQGMSDILVLLCISFASGCISYTTWLAKDAIKYVPGLGWGLAFLETVFLKRDWMSDEKNIRATFARFVDEKVPIWLIMFPEGTRMTPAKHEKSVALSKEKGTHEFKHLLYPRPRGFSAAVLGLRDHIDAVYSVTIGYENGAPTLTQLIRGDHDRVHAHVKRFPVAVLPEKMEDISNWLVDDFVNSDEALKEFNAKNRF